MSRKEEGLWYCSEKYSPAKGAFAYSPTKGKSWSMSKTKFYLTASSYYPSKYSNNTKVGPPELAEWGSD